MNGSAAWHLVHSPVLRTLLVLIQTTSLATVSSAGLGIFVPSNPGAPTLVLVSLWKKQVRPVALSCWMIAMSSKVVFASRPASVESRSKYFRQSTTVSTFGLPVSMVRTRENGTHRGPWSISSSCGGRSHVGTVRLCTVSPVLIGSTIPSMQLIIFGSAPITSAQVFA